MGIFGRKRRPAEPEQRRGRHAAPEPEDLGEDYEDPQPVFTDGPFDVADAPEDEIPRIDLGSVRVPVPDGSQVQVEMDPAAGGVRAVHVVTPQGQITVSAYAAPRSGGLWEEVGEELTEQLRKDGARVQPGQGEWGFELSALIGDVALRFVGVDGPRWMLRGVIAGPQSLAAEAPGVLRDIVRDTIVVRGDSPMPVRSPLPITLPDAVAQHVAEQQAQQA
ncbi:DUF3710 domain-containing protein [Amycolatopsis acidiphila]|uniref:DUF3710 domain-containing protein n=1 Tax=Amycolatopsis acidiphila TaxID=715473 RepID=A0A557ZV29_9PSEU|nr:DUF3710 domain-containing protein [Amycolatopsis acidiphila]TVT15874.1 DUF3710 domain-containing protein [Amycolatopsis acidiphila]UIJ58107.1 DUF3710 domain-containing protein [Amycolatopsis acidiphila]GHG70035.1 hypothetical protein GCM10017788_30730 [Amycolatopsis acidiphila]